MKNSIRITFLYAEITTYLFGCLKYLAKNFSQYSVEVIYLNKSVNVKLSELKQYEFRDKNSFNSRKNLLNHLEANIPNILLVSGRIDKDYLFVTKKIKTRCTTVSVQDTIYTNSIKHIIKKILSKFIYKNYFDKIWATGSLHSAFALSMGYGYDDIRDGFYIADEKYFNEEIKLKFNGDALNFLFIGRLVKEKNIKSFAKSLDLINVERKSKHKLKIIGKGVLQEKIKKYKCVDLLGYKNIDEMIHIASECHVFCLPSKFEPWGVVLHEMALLGLPILASENCGSAFDLVQNNNNGFKFKPNDFESIKNSIHKFLNLSNNQKIKFGNSSRAIALKLNHDYWCKNLISLLD